MIDIPQHVTAYVATSPTGERIHFTNITELYKSRIIIRPHHLVKCVVCDRMWPIFKRGEIFGQCHVYTYTGPREARVKVRTTTKAHKLEFVSDCYTVHDEFGTPVQDNDHLKTLIPPHPRRAYGGYCGYDRQGLLWEKDVDRYITYRHFLDRIHPGVLHKRIPMYRHPATTRELRDVERTTYDTSHRIKIRGARKTHYLRNAWDDVPIAKMNDRSWKVNHKLRHQWQSNLYNRMETKYDE